MGQIYLLDCTLRDGGYVNNWEFGGEGISRIKAGLEEAGVDILELGFFREEPWSHDRSVFGSGADAGNILTEKKSNVLYSAMIEGKDPDALYPIGKLCTPNRSGIDYIRVCTWKRLMKEHLEYCRKINEQGYQVSIQPTAVEQYGTQEFIELLKRSNEVKPYAVYLVDTWGTQSSFAICRYAELAEEYLDPGIKIGYHGHNNKMQALSCAEALLKMGLSHDVCLDATIMGMGRGVGNLQTEVIMEHLNENYGKCYDCLKMVQLYERWLKRFYEAAPWGYSMYHYLSALYSCPQDFATYFRQNNISVTVFQEFLEGLKPGEKIMFRREFVEKRLEEMKEGGMP